MKGQNKSEIRKLNTQNICMKEKNYNCGRRKVDALFKESAVEVDADAIVLHAKMHTHNDLNIDHRNL